jgi:hypothetical protein
MLAMRTLYIAATCILLAASAAHAGKQKHVVRGSDFPSAVNGQDMANKHRAAKSQLKARSKGSNTSVSARTAPSRSAADLSDAQRASRHEELVTSTPARETAKDTPVKDTVVAPAKDIVIARDIVVPTGEKADTVASEPASAAADTAASYDPKSHDPKSNDPKSYDAKSPIGEWITEDGKGQVPIRDCGRPLCGVISSGDPKETDRHNPDANKRNQPLVGTVLIDIGAVVVFAGFFYLLFAARRDLATPTFDLRQSSSPPAA